MKTALITGASNGIGRELAAVFAENGWETVLVSRNAARLDELARGLSRDAGVPSRALPMDLSRPGASERLFQELRSDRIDALVNNAGIGSFGLFSEIDPD